MKLKMKLKWACMSLLPLLWISGVPLAIGDPVPSGFNRNIVTFIFQQHETNALPIGTGFFVSVHTKGIPTVYLVTSKHVLFTKERTLVPHIFLRMNKSEGGGFYNLHLPFEGEGSSRVYTNSDPSVDIAVVPLLWDIKATQVGTLPSNLIASRDSLKHFSVREGDEIFFLGLFTPFYGSKKNIPLYRFGRVSMMPDEKVHFAGTDEDLLLMETQAFGGNSGAPCFFYFDERRNPNDTKMLLAGIVKGYFMDWSEVCVVETKQTPFASQNVGIAAVTPAYYLLDILDCEELQKFRAKIEQVTPSLKGPPPVTPSN